MCAQSAPSTVLLVSAWYPPISTHELGPQATSKASEDLEKI